jgi:hypothetical protein
MDDIQAVSKIVYAYAERLDLGDIEGCARLSSVPCFGSTVPTR